MSSMTVKQIEKSQLVIGNWYVGKGRNGEVGRWDGECFEVITDCLVYNGSFKTKQKTKPGIKFEPYFTAKEGCFQPFNEISIEDAKLSPGYIPMEQLKVGCFYIADDHKLLIGRWEGDCFSVLKNGDDQSRSEIEFKNHCDLKGSFRPLLLVNEGEVIEPYIENGREHLVYASVINF